MLYHGKSILAIYDKLLMKECPYQKEGTGIINEKTGESTLNILQQGFNGFLEIIRSEFPPWETGLKETFDKMYAKRFVATEDDISPKKSIGRTFLEDMDQPGVLSLQTLLGIKLSWLVRQPDHIQNRILEELDIVIFEGKYVFRECAESGCNRCSLTEV